MEDFNPDAQISDFIAHITQFNLDNPDSQLFRFPINDHIKPISEQIFRSDLNSIVSPTGTGKSIGIPAALAYAGYNVFVTEPTRSAVRAHTLRQTKIQEDFGFNLSVGSAAEGDVKYNDNTNIVYATEDHLRNKVLSCQGWGFTDILIIDEAHTGSVSVTMIISLWKYFYDLRTAMKLQGEVNPDNSFVDVTDKPSTHFHMPILVLLSATPNLTVNKYVTSDPIPTYIVTDANRFKISTIFHETRNTYSDIVSLTKRIHDNSPPTNNHILIFIPGISELNRVYGGLVDIFKLQNKQLSNTDPVIFKAIGTMDPDELDAIYNEIPNRKIIIGTNVAEASITIPNVGFVIDSMEEKITYTSNTGGIILKTEKISHSSSVQRMGRTGRTKDGEYHPMISQEEFLKLVKSKPPEMERVPIHDVVIQLLNANIDPTSTIHLQKARFESSLKLLTKLNMIAYDSNPDSPTHYKVTEIGHFAVRTGTSVTFAYFLWLWIKAGYNLYEGVALISLIQSGTLLSVLNQYKIDRLTDSEIQEDKLKKYKDFIANTHIESLVNIWNEIPLYQNVSAMSKSYFDPKELNQWCREHYLSNRAVTELINTVFRILSNLNYRDNITFLNYRSLISRSYQIFLRSHFDIVCEFNDETGKYLDIETDLEYIIDTKSTLMKDPPRDKILVLTVFNANRTSLITCFLNISEDDYSRIRSNRDKIYKNALKPWISENVSNPNIPYDNWWHVPTPEIVKIFSSHQITYPYRAFYRDSNEVINSMVNLINYVPAWSTTEYTTIEKPDSEVDLRFKIPGIDPLFIWMQDIEQDFFNMDWVADWYVEPARLKCIRGSFKSPSQAWDEYGSYLETALEFLKAQRQSLNRENLREALYRNKDIKECGLAKPSFFKGVFRYLGSTLGKENPVVIDVCSGWGDRMLGAMSAECSAYCGIDANKSISEPLTNMCELMLRVLGYPEDRLQYYRCKPLSIPVVEYEIEDIPESSVNRLPGWVVEGVADIVVMSPPYYDAEKYSDDTGQSTTRFPEIKDWYWNFLFAGIEQAWNWVREDGGYFVLQSINVQNIWPYIMNIEGIYFCGCISVKVASRYKPLWIWKKGVSFADLEVDDIERQRRYKSMAIEELKEKFPGLLNGMGINDDIHVKLLPWERNRIRKAEEKKMRAGMSCGVGSGGIAGGNVSGSSIFGPGGFGSVASRIGSGFENIINPGFGGLGGGTMSSGDTEMRDTGRRDIERREAVMKTLLDIRDGEKSLDEAAELLSGLGM